MSNPRRWAIAAASPRPATPSLAAAGGELPPVAGLVVVGVGVPGSPVPALVLTDAAVQRRDLERVAG